MSNTVTKDPDNKWYTYMDWTNWVTKQQEKTGNTITITGSSWALPSDLVQENDTPTTPEGNLTYLIGSGGTDGEDYEVTNTITYTMTHGSVSVTDLTQDASFTIRVREQ